MSSLAPPAPDGSQRLEEAKKSIERDQDLVPHVGCLDLPGAGPPANRLRMVPDKLRCFSYG